MCMGSFMGKFYLLHLESITCFVALRSMDCISNYYVEQLDCSFIVQFLIKNCTFAC